MLFYDVELVLDSIEARRKGVTTSLWNAARKICEAGGAKPNYWY